METQQKDRQGLAIASLVLGILDLIAWFFPICGLPIGIAGLVLGIMSIKSESRRLAIAGLIMSAIGLLLSIANGIGGAWYALQG